MTVSLTSRGNFHDQHNQLVFLKGVGNSPIAYPQAVQIVVTGQLFAARRSRIVDQLVDSLAYPSAEGFVEPP
jgi:hypothetical protein